MEEYEEFGEGFERAYALLVRWESAWIQLSDVDKRRVSALNELKTRAPKRYAVLILHIKGHVSSQIAALLGISQDSVHQHLSRARRSLAMILSADDVRAEPMFPMPPSWSADTKGATD